MKTYWVVTVRDPGDRRAGVSRYERRFEFGEPNEASECVQGARKAGFQVWAANVSTTREKVFA
jgi:hypothetical protein